MLVSSVVMSGTLGPRHARGSLGYVWMSVFACATMVGLPVYCAVGMTASLGTIVLLVLRPVCSWLLELPSRQHEMPGRPTQAANYTQVKAQTT